MRDSRFFQILTSLIHGEQWRFAMSAPIPLRQDFDASQLRGLAKKTKDGPQARRLLAVVAIYDGAMRTEAAKISLPVPRRTAKNYGHFRLLSCRAI